MSTDNTNTGPIKTVGNNQFLDRKDFDFKKREAIRDNLFWKAFNLGVYLLFFSFIAGYSSYYINEYLEKKNYENWIYYILIVFLVISVFMIMLIIVLFLIIPYSKLRGVMLLVKSMSNIYGADYADPDIHNSMGTILGKNEDDGKQISNFLLTSHGNVPSQIIRSFNPGAYTEVDTTNPIGRPIIDAPASMVEDGNGEQREVTALPAPSKPIPALRPLQKINVSTENSSPEESTRFKTTDINNPRTSENPAFNPNIKSSQPLYYNKTPTSYPYDDMQTPSSIPPPAPAAYDKTPLKPIVRTQEIIPEKTITPDQYYRLKDRQNLDQALIASDEENPASDEELQSRLNNLRND